jgi:glycosyltransferase involved in cell wall biosynthesis
VIDTLGLGGAEIHCLRLAAALDRNKYEIHVACGANGPLESLAAELGIHYFNFSDRTPKLASFRTLRSIWRLCRYIKTNHIDIVHTYLYTGHVIAALAALVARRPVVEHVHDYRYQTDDIARRAWHVQTRHYRFVRLFHRLSARTIVLTPETLGALAGSSSRRRSACLLVPNGVPAPPRDRTSRDQLCVQLTLPTDTAWFLVAGSLTLTKDVALALRGFAQAHMQMGGITLLIAGDGPMRESLTELARTLLIDKHVRFLGAVADLYGLLIHCAAVLHPSHSELNSLTIIEAMRCAVPVVARGSVSGNRLLIDNGRTGWLIETADVSEWAQTILEIARNAERRLCIGEAARQEAQARFDLQQHAGRIQEIYDSLDTPRYG